MNNVTKHLISFILPITVLILIPLDIERDISVKNPLILLIGISIMLVGLYVMAITISTFMRIGKGTLAPWSPPKKLIVIGVYRYVRNPMIIGVIAVLIGESIAIMSLSIIKWAGLFFIINNVYFILYEEPSLEKKFGDDYREYKKKVPRWIPRSKPFNPSSKIN